MFTKGKWSRMLMAACVFSVASMLSAEAVDKENFALFKKSIWKCKSKYEGGVRRDVAKKFHHYSGKATGGNVHLFDGVGEDLMKLAFEKDKAGTPPDLFGKLPFGESVLTYFQGGHNAPLVVWRFVLDENVAIKSLNYYINGSVISSTSLFECERIAGQ